MRRILKNIESKTIIIILLSAFVFIFLMRLNHTDFLTTFRGIYGGISLNLVSSKMGFIFFVILLQYINTDIILYNLRNAPCLLIRYGSKEKLILALVGNVMVCNFWFVALTGVGAVIGAAIIGGLDLTGVNLLIFLEILIRGYISCCIISMVQIILLIRTSEANTFLGLMVFVFILSFLSVVPGVIITICPVALKDIKLLIHIVLCIGIILILIRYLKKVFSAKEIY